MHAKPSPRRAAAKAQPEVSGPQTSAPVVEVKPLPVPVSSQTHPPVPVRNRAVQAAKTRAKEILLKPSVVATATVATAVAAEVGLHLLTQGKLTPSKVVNGLAKTGANAVKQAPVTTTVTEMVTITKKIQTTRG